MGIANAIADRSGAIALDQGAIGAILGRYWGAIAEMNAKNC